LAKISPTRQENLTASASRRFELQEIRQLFIRMHNETLAVVAIRVCDPDCSPVGIHSGFTAERRPHRQRKPQLNQH
jgi:hypothetical protein